MANDRKQITHTELEQDEFQPLEIYQPKCKLCKHENRRSIEHSFAQYEQSIADIVAKYPDLSFDNVIGHFRHSGLKAKRDADLLHPLRLIVDRGMTQGVKLTGEVVIRAVELQAKITGKLKPDNTVNIVNILNNLDDAALDAIETEATIEDVPTPD